MVASPDYYTLEGATAEAIIGMWAEVGIRATIRGADLAQKLELMNENNHHVFPNSCGDPYGDPEAWLIANLGPSNFIQQDGWWPEASAARFNEIGRQAKATVDQQARDALFQQMLDAIEAEAACVPLYIPTETYAMAAWVDWAPYSLYYMDLRPSNFRARS